MIDNIDNKELWGKIVKKLSESISYPALKTWFSQAEVKYTKTDGGGVVIGVVAANNFCSEQLKNRYAIQIRKAAEEIIQQTCHLDFSVGSLSTKKPSNDTLAPLFAQNFAKSSNGESLNPNYQLDNFVVGKSNSLAYAAATVVSQNPGGSYNPLFIYGGVGVGKTHLMEACGNAILASFPQAKVIYTTCERFTNEFIESLTFRKSSSFRQKFRKAEVLLIDDIQFLSGRESTQEEFFHTFNELYGVNKQIVLTCDRHPAEIGRIEERLVSRFLGGLTVDIGQPDLEMRIAILKAKCQARGVVIDNSVFEFLASTVNTNTRELEGALIKLLSVAKVVKRTADLELAKEIFSYKKQGMGLKIAPSRVVSAVARHFGIKISQINGKKRDSFLVLPRQLAMFVLRDELGLSLPEIGKLIGDRDHTTVIHAVDKVKRLLEVDDGLRKELALIRQSLVGFE